LPPGEPFEIGDIGISPSRFPTTPADPVGFVFQSEGVRMGFATDLGYISPNVKAQLRKSGPFAARIQPRPGDGFATALPWTVKQRVLSRVGPCRMRQAGRIPLKTATMGRQRFYFGASLCKAINLPKLARVAS